MQRAHEAVPDADLAAVDRDLGGRVFVDLARRAAEGRGEQQHAQLAAHKRVDGESGPRQQAAQFARPLELADGVEAAVEDAVAALQFAEQPPQRVRGRRRLRGQARGLRRREIVAQLAEPGRVLAHEQLEGEVTGVERAREGPQLRLVQLEAEHLADAELHAVEAYRAVLLQVREHEGERQPRRGLRHRGLRLGFDRLGGGPAGQDRRRALREFE